jgi:bacillopeptidase F
MKNTIKLKIACVLGFVLLSSGSGLAGTLGPELAARLALLQPDEEVDVLVSFTDQLDLKKFRTLKGREKRTSMNTALRIKAAQSQKMVARILRNAKGKNIRSFWIINGMAATVRAGTVQEIVRQPGVSKVSLDGKLRLPVTEAFVPTSAAPWNIDITGAGELWQQGYDGSGIVVAIVDTGVDPLHQDLQARWRGGSNSWYDPNGEHLTPYDHDGHGTGVAGIILGGDAGGSAIGMAPGARWIGVKIFDDTGEASYSDIHLGFQWLLDPDNDPQTNDLPDLVNNSWGLNALVDQCITEFQPDIQLLLASDIAVNFSAGNAGPAPATSISPANYPESFAVGGVDSTLNVTDFSSRGPSACTGAMYPQIVAPAVDIRTADLTFGGVFPDNYAVVSGTSFAVPHITGAMALLKDASPWLNNDELRQIITLSAVDAGAPGPDNDSGYGLLDMVAALNLLEANTCTAQDGSFFFSPDGCGPQPPPGTIRGIAPIIQLLLGSTLSHGNQEGFARPRLIGTLQSRT